MITAIVLISADVDRIPEVAQEIADLDGVTEVYSVAGDADLIALVRVRQHEDLADVIADRLNKVKGVTGTATHIAFRTYSKHDLETAFSLGLELHVGVEGDEAAGAATFTGRRLGLGARDLGPSAAVPGAEVEFGQSRVDAMPGAPQRQWLP